MYNVNPDTNVRYGVISMRSLDSDLEHELFHGPGATDLSYAEAYRDAKADAEKRFEDARQDAVCAAAENGVESPRAIDEFIDKEIEAQLGTCDDVQFVEDELEAWSDMYQSEEPTIEGTYEGVKYRISWLGGAPLLWVIEGPIGSAAHLCSMCVPNAADLDNGFVHNLDISDGEHPFACYVVPNDWLAEVTA